ARIKIQIKPEFRKRFQGKSQENTIFFYPVIIAHHCAKRSDPTGEIAIDRITLLLKQPGRRLVLLLHCYSPVVVNPVISAEGKQAAVKEKWIVVKVAVANVDLQVRHRLYRYGGIDFGKPFIKSRHLGINGERGPWQRRKTNLVEKIRIRSAIIRILKIDIEIGFEFEPRNIDIVAPRLEAVADAEPPDRPAINRSDGRELREIDRAQFGGWFESVELQNLGWVQARIRNP